MPGRAILLDLDNTLLLEDDATDEALRSAADRAGRRAAADPAVILAAARRAAESLFQASPTFPYADEMGIWWGEALWGEFAGSAAGLRALRDFAPRFRHAVWANALAAAGVSDAALVDEVAAAFREARTSLDANDPDAATVLDVLGRDHRLALVTNGAPDVQREKLARAGLAERFAAVVISAEVGVGKPDPRIFRTALDALGVSAEDAMMVGDSLERDIAGAARAGLRSIWLDRAGVGAAGSSVPDVRIRSLRELPDAVSRIERIGASPQPA